MFNKDNSPCSVILSQQNFIVNIKKINLLRKIIILIYNNPKALFIFAHAYNFAIIFYTNTISNANYYARKQFCKTLLGGKL